MLKAAHDRIFQDWWNGCKGFYTSSAPTYNLYKEVFGLAVAQALPGSGVVDCLYFIYYLEEILTNKLFRYISTPDSKRKELVKNFDKDQTEETAVLIKQISEFDTPEGQQRVREFLVESEAKLSKRVRCELWRETKQLRSQEELPRDPDGWIRWAVLIAGPLIKEALLLGPTKAIPNDNWLYNTIADVLIDQRKKLGARRSENQLLAHRLFVKFHKENYGSASALLLDVALRSSNSKKAKADLLGNVFLVLLTEHFKATLGKQHHQLAGRFLNTMLPQQAARQLERAVKSRVAAFKKSDPRWQSIYQEFYQAFRQVFPSSEVNETVH